MTIGCQPAANPGRKRQKDEEQTSNGRHLGEMHQVVKEIEDGEPERVDSLAIIEEVGRVIEVSLRHCGPKRLP